MITRLPPRYRAAVLLVPERRREFAEVDVGAAGGALQECGMRHLDRRDHAQALPLAIHA